MNMDIFGLETNNINEHVKTTTSYMTKIGLVARKTVFIPKFFFF